MKIVAVTNIKGGVGKTTTAANLAYLCAASGQRTLLWDLDPQRAATHLLGIDPNEHEQTSAKKLLASKCDVPELIIATAYSNLDLLSANLSYRKFDIQCTQEPHRAALEYKPFSSRGLRSTLS
jgi:chromosome partitioning protein